MRALPESPVSREAYLEHERQSEERHQLWDGEVFPMIAPSYEHALLVRNLIVELTLRLRGTRCEALPSNVRVRLPGERYVYPDVVIVCGRPRLEDEHEDNLLNPRVVFEVLSPSTERFDRGDKFAGYRALESLTDYVLVAQQRRAVDHYRRQDDGTWILRPIEEGDLQLESVDVTIALDEIYRDLEI